MYGPPRRVGMANFEATVAKRWGRARQLLGSGKVLEGITAVDTLLLLFAVVALCWVALDSFGPPGATWRHLAYRRGGWARRPWTVVLSGYAHAAPFPAIINGMVFKAVGDDLERQLGYRNLILAHLFCNVAAVLAFELAGAAHRPTIRETTCGAQFGNFALLVLCSFHLPRSTFTWGFFGPLPALEAAVVLALVEMSLGSASVPRAVGFVGGAGAAALLALNQPYPPRDPAPWEALLHRMAKRRDGWA